MHYSNTWESSVLLASAWKIQTYFISDYTDWMWTEVYAAPMTKLSGDVTGSLQGELNLESLGKKIIFGTY